MPRNNNLTQAELSNSSLRIIDLITIELPSGTLRYTNYEGDITITSDDGSTLETYLTGKGYIAHSEIKITASNSNTELQLFFDSVALDSTADSLGVEFANGDYAGAPVTIKKGLIKDPIEDSKYWSIFNGIVDNFSINLTDDESRMTITVGNPFANFDKKTLYGYTNSNSQKRIFPNDEGFQFAQRKVSNLKWEE